MKLLPQRRSLRLALAAGAALAAAASSVAIANAGPMPPDRTRSQWIMNFADQKICLTADESTGFANGASLSVAACRRTGNPGVGFQAVPAQRWTISTSGETTTIRHTVSGRCLDAEAATLEALTTRLQLLDCAAVPGQQWYAARVTLGTEATGPYGGTRFFLAARTNDNSRVRPIEIADTTVRVGDGGYTGANQHWTNTGLRAAPPVQGAKSPPPSRMR